MDFLSKLDPYILDVINRLQTAGYETYLVGGAVRDILLGREPKDYDISTAATPRQICNVFKTRHVIIIGRRFQLVHLFKGKTTEHTEISTFRCRPSQEKQKLVHPRLAGPVPENMIFNDNAFGTAEDDAFRRDFTINALFYSPSSNEVVDFTGKGLKDLKKGVVRAIGEPLLRFEEDPVRILRAIKLAGQYGFSIERATERALRKQAKLISLAPISRLSLELEKILMNPYTGDILEAFHKFGFLKHYLPNLEKRFKSPPMQYALQMLEMRKKRTLAGLYRISHSSPIAMIALPFVETEIFQRQCGTLWPDFHGFMPLVENLLHELFHPLVLTEKTIRDTCSMLAIQPAFLKEEKLPCGIVRNCYTNSYELALIQNSLMWHLPSFETTDFEPESFVRRKKRRRNLSRFHSRRGGRPHASNSNVKENAVEDELFSFDDNP